MSNWLQTWLSRTPSDKINSAMAAYVANLDMVASVSPATAKSTVAELADQRSSLKLIASENYCSLPTQLAMGNLLTDKYAEGYAGHRFYAGCANVDDIESLACQTACDLFGAQNAYVQGHSGADANMIAFLAILATRVQAGLLEEIGEPNPAKLSREDWDKVRGIMRQQKLLALDYYSGGHLTHGYRFNVSAQFFDAYSYSVSKETGVLDYDEIEKQALEIKPLILLAGYSAYPRKVNFKRMKEIADKVGAVFMVDMAHFAGLVAGKVFTGDYDPVAHADVVTATTHKTLRGPRGGLVLCTDEFAENVNKGCPLVIGGPLPHVMAAKAVAFTEALTPEFQAYSQQVVDNCAALAAACQAEGLEIVTGGTENHLALIDVTGCGLTGRQAESALREAGVTLNRNSLPFDPNGAWYTSGLRVGTPAVTTLGMGPEQMKEIAAIIALVLKNTTPKIAKSGKPGKAKYEIADGIIDQARTRVQALLDQFVLYPELDLDFLQEMASVPLDPVG
jgi:glycine hydroxymethyltransferase